MDFKKYLEKSVKGLDRELEKILKEQLKKAERTDRKLIPLIKAFTRSCQGGKRIRGSLVMLGFQLAAHLRGENVRWNKAHLGGEILKVAAAYEICHSAILAHDDIIDESLTRRGQPSLYVAFGGGHYGISQAICLADYGFFLSYNIFSETDFPDDCKIKALNLFSKVMMNTTWGEMLDMEETDPFIVMKLKTAYYTIAGPLQIGAILAGADEKLIGVLEKFGENLGVAFQIKDDILDNEVAGTGGSNSAKNEAKKYENRAMKIVPEITKDQKTSKLLKQLGEYLVRRTK
ncbi:MAG: polyprenyl synthetase family protein [Candidatus Daviesbacteria bacterium]|nr:polyprenyl synthetase family protein [Candidatus Daviesbacteria bacterium]